MDSVDGTDKHGRAFAPALRDGQAVQGEYGAAVLRDHLAGELILTSGSLVACDPILMDEEPAPFEQRIKPGLYPIVLSVAHFANGDQRVAYATLWIKESLPVRWDIARSLGVEMSAESDPYVWSYESETGQGCFVDADVLNALLEHQDPAQLDDEPGYAKLIDEAVSKTFVNTWGWANVSLAPMIEANIIAFSSGFGDGAYLTYIGYDADDDPICFTTDFDLF